MEQQKKALDEKKALNKETLGKEIKILGIESSCDETAAAVVVNGRQVLSNVISSQVELHAKYGGVVPELASRKHVENISLVVQEALDKAGLGIEEIDEIAVTYGPGLVGALLVGVSFAKGLSYTSGKPLKAVNHIEAHIAANFLEDSPLDPVKQPFISLVASGGHTHLVEVFVNENQDYPSCGALSYKIHGRTRDDAVGEAYDKVARALGLGYPGGPLIDKLSKEGSPSVLFPRVFLEEGSYDFSFSGIKSAVLNYLNKSTMTGIEINKADIAASFQDALLDVLTAKTITLCKSLRMNTLTLSGGVACNSSLRGRITALCQKNNITLHMPKPIYCTDNAAMVAACAYFTKGNSAKLQLNAVPSLKIQG